MRRTRITLGFTLTELMVVVVILGVIAGIVGPGMIRYVRRARSSEAVTNVQRIYAAQYTYNSEIHERGLSGNFVNAPATPSTAPSASKYAANVQNWTGQAQWVALGFALDTAHFFQYSSPSTNMAYTARAQGDLNGNGVPSTFARVGSVHEGEIQGTALIVENDYE